MEQLRYARARADTMAYDHADQYFEILSDEVVRQVTHYRGRWFSSLQEWFEPVGMLLSEAPIQEADFLDGSVVEITALEFEAAWEKAMRDPGGQAQASSEDSP